MLMAMPCFFSLEIRTQSEHWNIDRLSSTFDLVPRQRLVWNGKVKTSTALITISIAWESSRMFDMDWLIIDNQRTWQNATFVIIIIIIIIRTISVLQRVVLPVSVEGSDQWMQTFDHMIIYLYDFICEEIVTGWNIRYIYNYIYSIHLLL